jgi:hypothetical protein
LGANIRGATYVCRHVERNDAAGSARSSVANRIKQKRTEAVMNVGHAALGPDGEDAMLFTESLVNLLSLYLQRCRCPASK